MSQQVLVLNSQIRKLEFIVKKFVKLKGDLLYQSMSTNFHEFFVDFERCPKLVGTPGIINCYYCDVVLIKKDIKKTYTLSNISSFIFIAKVM